MPAQPQSLSLAQLAEQVGGDVHGDGSVMLCGVSTLSSATSSQISFLTNGKYRSQLQSTEAGAVILHPNEAENCPLPGLLHNNPHAAFARIAQIFDTTPGVGCGRALPVLGEGGHPALTTLCHGRELYLLLRLCCCRLASWRT